MLEVELKAIMEEGILLARELGLKELILESDAQIATMALSSPGSPPKLNSEGGGGCKTLPALL